MLCVPELKILCVPKLKILCVPNFKIYKRETYRRKSNNNIHTDKVD